MMCKLLGAVVLSLLVAHSVADAERRSLQHQPWRDATAGDLQLQASPQDFGVRLTPHARKAPVQRFSADTNSLREVLQVVSDGEGKEKEKKKDDDEDEDKKTLSQQIKDGKYGLIEKEIYSKPPLRPGIISYKNNPEVPNDTIKNLGGLDAEEIWLAEDHVLVLRGGWFPNHSYNRSEVGAAWPPIDDYKAPLRQVKIPARPKVPPPFPVQLTDGGPTHFIGPNGTRAQYPFPPPFFPFPPGDGYFPPPGNGSSYPPPPFPFPPPPRNGSSYPPATGNYPYPPPGGSLPPGNGNFPYPQNGPPPPPPFLPNLPPGASFLPPPGNQTEIDEDDPSIYYPPPYDFYYPQDNTTHVPPGPLVPGIILPPPPNFFAPLEDGKHKGGKRPATSTPFGVYTPTPSPPPRPNVAHRVPLPHVPIRVYPKPVTSTPRPTPFSPIRVTKPPQFYYPQDPSTTIPDSVVEDVTQPSPPYNNYVPSTRPTVKRPYLAYVPVTTAQRKKKPRPTSTPIYEHEVTNTERPSTTILPAVYDTPRPKPPKFSSPQNVQLFHKGDSPITVRPYYSSDVTETNAVATPTPQPNPQYITDGLGKLKEILYTTPIPTISYHLGGVQDVKPKKRVKPDVTTVDVVKSIEYTTENPSKYFTDLTKRPIYVKEYTNHHQGNQQADVDSNSVVPTSSYRGGKAGTTTTTTTTTDTPFLPIRNPKTTYYFYEEPHYEQGYVRDITTKPPYAYNPTPKWQYNGNINSQQQQQQQQQANYNQYLGNLQKSQEEMLLAQIAETLRQPGNGYYYNAPNKQPLPNYYNPRVRPQSYYPRPAHGYVNSTPRPGFYITRKPEFYPIAPTENPFREFPYNFEDVVQSTEHPQRPRYQQIVTPSRLRGPDHKVQTSPKTVYEYSFQKQSDTNNYVQTTDRPRQHPPTTAQYYEDYSQNASPETNQLLTTPRPPPHHHHQQQQPVTPDPLQHYYTQSEDTVLDDITKKYFTIFGQKLQNGHASTTTPLPAQGGGGAGGAGKTRYENHHPTPVPLYNDVAVNYRTPRPPINPDAEFIDQDGDEGAGKLISYKLPGNEGGHFYFVTPQVVPPSHRERHAPEEEAYQYPVPERQLRTRRNKTKQR